MFTTSDSVLTVYDYKIGDIVTLQKKYKLAVAEVFMFIKQLKPKDNLVKCGQHLLKYQYNLLTLVEDILKIKNKTIKNINDYTKATYNELLYSLGIQPEKYDLNKPYYINVWGPMFWNFLHLTSILCETTYQKNLFASLMLNFNLCLICSTCAYNYKGKNPFKLTMAIALTQDPTTNIFEFHNIVNVALNKQPYPFEQFLKDYNLVTIKQKTVKIIYIE